MEVSARNGRRTLYVFIAWFLIRQKGGFKIELDQVLLCQPFNFFQSPPSLLPLLSPSHKFCLAALLYPVCGFLHGREWRINVAKPLPAQLFNLRGQGSSQGFAEEHIRGSGP